MPNRILKESICYSENLEGLSLFQEVFFYRLIVNCDDYGRMDARPKVLASKLFPLRDIRLNQVTDALKALSSAELVVLYEEEGHPFLQMKTWDRHQSIRAKKSKYPAPDINCMQLHADDFNCNQMKSDESKCSRNPIQSVSESVSNPYPNPTRGGAKKPTDDPAFIIFWNEYPKKVSKPDAIKAWEKLKPDVDTVGAIMKGLQRWKESGEWKQNDGQFIPYPATWLNKRRWEDDVRPASQAPAPVKTVAAQEYKQRDYSGEDADTWRRMLEGY